MYQLHFFEEISNREFGINEVRNILAAVVRQYGSIIKTNNHIKLELSVPEYTKAFFINGLIRKLFDFGSEIKTSVSDGISREKQYLVIIPPQETKKVLVDLNIITVNNDEITDYIKGVPGFSESAEDFAAFMTGMMIASGSVFIPQDINNGNFDSESDNSGYRLEISPVSEELAGDIIKRLKGFNIPLKSSVRKETGLLYTADGDTVCDLLALTGASGIVTKLQNMIIERSIKNNSNRQRNCNIANIDKSIAAAEKIIEAIDLLKEKSVYTSLDIKLKEVGDLRYNNMDMSLEEIAKQLGVSKSCVNHRLRKITGIAKSL